MHRLTQGYLKDQEKSEQLWENGWLHTGDIGFIDEEGYLQVTDRIKDVIKTGGEWIFSWLWRKSSVAIRQWVKSP
jgi:fatty-acyl-CoA synthase